MRILALLITGLVVAAPLASQQAERLKGLDQYVEQSMQQWGIPGVALAVVKGDSIVHARGFGVRRLGDPAPVDIRTMFAIGSSSKAFTSAALAILVDEGKVGWDTRVVSVLPGFQLADRVATEQTTIRDLLSHRTGLPGENLVFWGTSVTREQIIDRLRFLPMQSSPRSRYQYQNLMYVVAGQLIPALTGASWDDFVANRILQPLGMSRTTPQVSSLGRFDNVATPHAPENGTMRPIAWLNLDNAGPAGSIVSDVIDMAQWIRLQLGRGQYRGRRLISEAQIRVMRTPAMPLPEEIPYNLLMPEAHLRSYGLGWMMHDYHDRLVVEHAGQTDGMHATVALMPEEQLGVVVLTNSVLFGFPTAVMYRVFDAYLGRPPRDWSAELRQAMRPMNDGGPPPPTSPRIAGTKPSLPLAGYAGTYRHPLYGDAVVELNGGDLVLKLLGGQTRLTHWQVDTFRTAWSVAMQQGMLGFATFVINSRGIARRLVFDTGIEFVREGA